MYKNKLVERDRRKNVVFEYSLIEQFFKDNPLHTDGRKGHKTLKRTNEKLGLKDRYEDKKIKCF